MLHTPLLLIVLFWPAILAATEPLRLDQGINWDYCNAQSLPSEPASPLAPLPNDPFQIHADQMTHDQLKAQSELSGSVQLWHFEDYAEADHLIYRGDSRTAELFGNLFIQKPGLRISATHGYLELDNDKGWLQQPQFRLTKMFARGEAKMVELQDKQRSHYQDVTYTTCPPGKNDWSLAASELDIDMEEGWGGAWHTRVQLGGVPVLYLPYFTFPVDNRRKSGFLPPFGGSTNRVGNEISTPYYFNLAPNYDATLTPHWMTKRGLMMGGEFRYLGDWQQAEISGELLQDDRVESPDHGHQRRALHFFHISRPMEGMSTRIETNAVSDNEYYDDFKTGLTNTSTRHLERVGEVEYHQGNLRLLGRLQKFQTIDKTLSKTEYPYQRIPQLLTTYQKRSNLLGLQLGLGGEYTKFKHETLTNGERLVLRPSLALPMQRSWGHLAPRLSLNYARYKLDQEKPVGDAYIDYFVPAFSLDSGLVFERKTHWFGSPAFQTLEPRLFYLYAPFDEQSEIPDFDTTDIDLTFSNLFKENRFTGSDRFGDANQIAMGLTTRWFQADDGMERFRASIGQIYYAKEREVQLIDLANDAPEDAPTSPLVAELSARLGASWSTTLSLQRDPRREEKNIDSGRFALHYSTANKQLFNIDYNFKREAINDNRETIKDLDISFYWPFNYKVSLFGKWKHSYLYERDMNRIAGFEYGGRCCWKFRTFYQRYVADEDIEKEEESRVMLQIELRGLSSLGQSADLEMQEYIYGYQAEH
ncbi:MAG: LPS assembly protein LptD [Candidatus Thiodiazotropha sp.]|jgi:LPS-assembly protein